MLTFPLVVVASALVKLTSAGPAIHTQTRVGRNGRKFVIYKVRTMYHDCERLTGPVWASARDPRVTPVGRVLRRTHLDELPQLWNVLRGEMSLIGPRPERPEIITQLERAIPRYRDRESIRPGVTGLAQVQLPPDTDLASVRRKLACDLWYIQRMGFWLDVRILLATALKVVGVPCSRSCRWLALPDGSPTEQDYLGTHGHEAPPASASGKTSGRLARPAAWAVLRAAVVAAALVWSYWPTLRAMERRWADDPRYSHGYLVPAFAAFLWWRRRDLPSAGPAGGRPWGPVVIAAGAGLRGVGGTYYLSWLDAASLIPTLAGVCLLAGGWAALRRAGPALAFLIFMVPLPYRVEVSLGAPLQRFATAAGTFALETAGVPAAARGNVILLPRGEIGVAEACNGLGMLYPSLAVAAGLALVARRPWPNTAALLASVPPVAVALNVARIAVTGLLQTAVGGGAAGAVYHGLAGWLMMPLALGAFCAELGGLDRLFTSWPASGGAVARPEPCRRPALAARGPGAVAVGRAIEPGDTP